MMQLNCSELYFYTPPFKIKHMKTVVCNKLLMAHTIVAGRLLLNSSEGPFVRSGTLMKRRRKCH